MATKPNIERTNVCKICGNKDNLRFFSKKTDQGVSFTVTCDKCHSTVKSLEKTIDRARTVAINNWNNDEGVFTNGSTINVPKVVKPKVEEKKEVVKTEPEKKADDKKSAYTVETMRISIPKEKSVSIAKGLINKFKSNFPKEDCPVTLGDLLKLFGMSDEEILKVLGIKNYKKQYIHSYELMIEELNKGNQLYYIDAENRTWKYSPIKKFNKEDSEQLINSLKAAGLNLKNTFILNNTKEMKAE